MRAKLVAGLLAAVAILTGCANYNTYGEGKAPEKPLTVVHVKLDDGRMLECISGVAYAGHTILDCNWEHPIREANGYHQ